MINSIGIHLKVKNFKRSYSFYKNLGFKPIFEYGPAKKVVESYSGVVFEHGTTKLEIADGHRAVKDSIFKEMVTSSKISLMINVDSLEVVVRKCFEYKIPIIVKPRHYYWGTLEMVLKDPDGVVVVFIAPYSQFEAKRLEVDETFSQKPI